MWNKSSVFFYSVSIFRNLPENRVSSPLEAVHHGLSSSVVLISVSAENSTCFFGSWTPFWMGGTGGGEPILSSME